MRILFANTPWYQLPENSQPGWHGVKAGSRWPHTFPYYGGSLKGGYVPFPFFLATAAALAKRKGFEAVVRDSIALGETYEEFFSFVESHAPQVLVLETTTPSLTVDLQVAQSLKKRFADTKIIFTGVHYDLEQESFLENQPFIDFVVYGEYEVSVVKVLEALQNEEDFSQISGLVYRLAGKVHKNSFQALVDLGQLPWPERASLPVDSYYDSVGGLPQPQLQVHGSRGCPFGCIFCVWPQVFYRNKGYRMREPNDIVAEIEAELARHPYGSIYFDDDTFNVSSKHVLEIARLFKEKGINRLPWSIMGRADLMTEEVLLALKDAGVYSIKYGVESGSQVILDEIDKGIDLEHVKKMVRFTKKLGIKVQLTFTFGLPSDTKETIEETIDLACELPCDLIQFSIATPFPGTKMYALYERNGWLLSKEWDLYNGSSKAVSRTKALTGEELEGYVQLAYERWGQTMAQRALLSPAFAQALSRKLEGVNKGAKILVLQCATFSLTQSLVRVLEFLHFDVHLLLHERFGCRFDFMAVEKLHFFNEAGDFNYGLLHKKAKALQMKENFAGAIVPYSNPTGSGYDEVEQVALAAATRILAGIGNDGTIVK